MEDLVGGSPVIVREAHAKLNLRLVVEGRDPRGYHLLSMFNVLTSLKDTLTFEFDGLGEGTDFEVSVGVTNADYQIKPEEDLTYRAAQAFAKQFGCRGRLRIAVEKQIPSGAGLGGGSSDAACVLRTMDGVFLDRPGCEAEVRSQHERKIFDIARELGSDVPYFFRGGFARVSGVGENIHRYDGDFIQGLPVVLVFPSEKLLTPVVYETFRSQRPSVPRIRDIVAEQFCAMLRVNSAAKAYTPQPSRTIRTRLWRQLLELIQNDLEPSAFALAPALGTLVSNLRTIPNTICGMTGSGSTLFLLSTREGGHFTPSDLAAIGQTGGQTGGTLPSLQATLFMGG